MKWNFLLVTRKISPVTVVVICVLFRDLIHTIRCHPQDMLLTDVIVKMYCNIKVYHKMFNDCLQIPK